jgi:hypothetical protein
MSLLALRCASLVLGPLLLAASTFFWEGGRYGVTGGVLVALSGIAWVYGLIGIWERLHPRLPVAAALGLVLTLLGTFGGIAFGLQGFFEGAFGLSAAESLAAVGEHPVASWLVLWGPGPLFPLSLVLLGAVLLWTRLVPRSLAVALLIAGAAFPLSRISRLDLLAHTIDALLLVASAWLATRLLRESRAGLTPIP